MNKEKLEANIQKIYIYKFFRMFLVLMPVIVPFFQSKGLSMKDVYILQAVFAVTVFITEVPSGYLADLLGRKKTLLVASGLTALGFLLFPFSSGMFLLCAAETVLGVAVSLSSGTDTSLLYDTLSAIGSKKAEIKILGRTIFYSSLGEAIAALLATLIMFYSVDLNLLAIISAVLCWIPLFVMATIEEPPRNLMSKTKHKDNLKLIYESMFKHSKLLNYIMLNMVFYFTSTLFAVWLFQKYWEDIHIPITYFGLLWALTNIVVSITARYAHKIEKWGGSSIAITLMGVLPVAGYLGMGLVETWWGILVCLLFQLCRGLSQVILNDALNRRLKGEYRATANSIVQMGGRIFFITVGPLVGMGVDKLGIAQTATYLGLFYIFIFIVVMLPLLLQKESYYSFKH